MLSGTRSFADRARGIFGGILMLVGFGSLLVWPLPVQLTFVSLIVGAIAGAFWLSTETVLEVVGAIVLYFGVQYVTHKADTLGPSVMWWQPGLVVVAACSLVFFLGARWLGSRRGAQVKEHSSA